MGAIEKRLLEYFSCKSLFLGFILVIKNLIEYCVIAYFDQF